MEFAHQPACTRHAPLATSPLRTRYRSHTLLPIYARRLHGCRAFGFQAAKAPPASEIRSCRFLPIACEHFRPKPCREQGASTGVGRNRGAATGGLNRGRPHQGCRTTMSSTSATSMVRQSWRHTSMFFSNRFNAAPCVSCAIERHGQVMVWQRPCMAWRLQRHSDAHHAQQCTGSKHR